MIKEDFAKNEYEYLLNKTKKAFENDDAYAIMDIINDKLGHNIRMIEDRSRIGDRFEAFWILKFDNTSYDLGYKTNTWGWEYYNPYKKETNNLTSVVNIVAMELIANGEWDDSPVIDDSNFKEYFEEYIEPLNTDELLSYTDIETSDTVKNNTAAFILPSGKVINVLDNTDDSHAIHNTVAVMIAEQVLRHFVNDYTNELNRCNEMLSYLTDTLGWIRINPGTTSTESRFYIVVPEEIRPTAEQYRKVLDFLDLSYDSYVKPIEVQVFAGDSGVDYHKYDFREYLPEDILKKIKQYYNVGELREDKKTKKRTKKSHTKNLGVTSGDIAADIKTFNTMMAPMGGSAACVGEGYKRPDKYYTVSDNKAEWTPEGEDYHYWSSEADDWAEDYAKAYRCKMSPKDFLDLTTSGGADSIKLGDNIWGEFKELDNDKFTSYEQPIYLNIWFDDKTNNHKAKVVGHEGRHRMFALMQKGVTSVDVVLSVMEYDTHYDKYHPFEIDWVILQGQFNKSVRKIIEPITPMSWKRHKEIRPNVKELKSYKNW